MLIILAYCWYSSMTHSAGVLRPGERSVPVVKMRTHAVSRHFTFSPQTWHSICADGKTVRHRCARIDFHSIWTSRRRGRAVARVDDGRRETSWSRCSRQPSTGSRTVSVRQRHRPAHDTRRGHSCLDHRSVPISHHSEMEQSSAELFWIIQLSLQVFLHTLCHAVTVTLTLLTLNVYSISGIMCFNSTKFERNRLIPGWVIDDLALFAPQF